MIKKLKTAMLTLASVGSFLVPALAPVAVSAQIGTDQGATVPGLCEGIELKVGETCDPQGNADQKINNLLEDIINIFSLIVGVVAVIMVIIGGLQYITSGGDSGKITTAKNTILYAVIGLVVVALAQFIVRFVLARVTRE